VCLCPVRAVDEVRVFVSGKASSLVDGVGVVLE